MHRLVRNIVSLTILILLTVSAAQAATGKVHEYRLRNGMKLLVKEDHRAPVVMSQVWYKVGSSYETEGLTGVSHVLEHMMFKGTKRYPDGELTRIVSELGGSQNAGTSSDYTVYYQKLAAKDLATSFELEADRMRHLILTKKDFAKEIKVVREERRMRTDNNPQSKTYERFNAQAHIASPYHHPVIGWMRDLNNMTVDDLKGWYKAWYTPNNAIVVVVGDVDPKRVYRLAKHYFGPIKGRSVPSLKPQDEIPPLGKRSLSVSLPAKLPWLVMGYNVPSLVVEKQQWKPYALEVLVAVLDGGDSARFSKNLVRGKQIATYVNTRYDMTSRLAGLLTFTGVPAKGHTLNELRNAIHDEIKRMQTTLVSADELKRIKTQVIAEKVYSQDSLSYQAYMIGGLEVVGLSWKESDAYVKKIQAVTPAQVREVAKEYLVPARLTIGELHPLPMDMKSVSEKKTL